MLNVEQRRFGYITPLSVSYFFVRLVILFNLLVFVALFFTSGAILFDAAAKRWITFDYWRIFSVGVSLAVPWYMEFWLSHTFFRIYYWILWAVLGGSIGWHAVQMIFYGIWDWSPKSSFYTGIDNESKGEYAFWMWFSFTGVLAIIYAVYLLFAVYIRRRTVDRMVLEAQTQANAISPSGLNPLLMDPTQQSMGADRESDAVAPTPSPFFTVGGTSNFPVMVPVGADLGQHPEGEQMRKNAQLLQDAGYDIELLALGVPLLQTRYSEDIGCHSEDGAGRRKKNRQKVANVEADNEGFLP